MAISGFQHLNIRCAESDLPAIEKFYGEVLGLKAGPRPNFPFNGLWLYDGDDPIVHVSGRFPKGSIVKDLHSGSVDHVAFTASGAVEFRARLKKVGVYFEEQNIPKAGYQVFLHDPVGTKLEFNFPATETPPELPSGTSAKMQVHEV
jgi:catechol 2,3-dioxygenase-like lactoylglutathione lyase family enzyme